MERKQEDNNTNSRLNSKRAEDSKNPINKVVDNTKKDLYNNLGTPKMNKVIKDTNNKLKNRI